MAQTGIHYEKWLRGDNSINIQGMITSSWVLPFHCLPSIYKPSYMLIHFVLSKIRPGQASSMKMGDNSIYIQGRIMVLALCPSLIAIYL